MRVFAGFCLLLLSVVALAAEPLTSVFTAANVRFPGIGLVHIRTIVKQGTNPQIVFTSSRPTHALLSANEGRGRNWREYVARSQPNDLDMQLRFVVLHRAGLPDPLIIALVKRQGGSDCDYEAAFFGEVDNKVSELTPDLPDFYTRGAILLSDNASGGLPTLAIASERYQPNDIHYKGPSRMAVYVYDFDPSKGKFVKTSESEVSSDAMHISGENVIGLFGTFPQC